MCVESWDTEYPRGELQYYVLSFQDHISILCSARPGLEFCKLNFSGLSVRSFQAGAVQGDQKAAGGKGPSMSLPACCFCQYHAAMAAAALLRASFQTKPWSHLRCLGVRDPSSETWVSAPQGPLSKLLFSDHLTHSLLCLALDVVAAPRWHWLGVISVSPFCFVSSLTPGQPVFYIKIFSVETTNIVSVSHLDPHRYWTKYISMRLKKQAIHRVKWFFRCGELMDASVSFSKYF